MYSTGIFSEFCEWEWDLSTGKCDFEKKWAGKWDWYPPFKTLKEENLLCEYIVSFEPYCILLYSLPGL